MTNNEQEERKAFEARALEAGLDISKRDWDDAYLRASTSHDFWWFIVGAKWQREQAAEVPEGYAIVPIEPTDEMVKASFGVAGATSPNGRGPRQYISIAWQEMIAAAPTPPQTQEKE